MVRSATLRPLYERPEHRLREAAVVARLVTLFGADHVKFGLAAVCDVLLIAASRPMRLIEVKVRTNPAGAYPTYMLSRRKYEDLLVLKKHLGAPVALVVQWSDRAGILELPAPYRLATGGRSDRGDPLDQEQVCHFQTPDFSTLWEGAA
jgi:hypothetical protein